jgi:hypothetical protein
MTGVEPAEYFPQLAEADLYVDAGEVTAFLRGCGLLRENLGVIAAAVDLSRQPGVAVNMATGLVAVVSDSPQVFREHVSRCTALVPRVHRRVYDSRAGPWALY